MTQEEKAKAYDRAIANAKKQAIDGYLDAVALNDIFPELKEFKESDDKKIRKSIIEFVKQNKSFHYLLGVSKEDAVAWLEKQGEQKPADKVEPKFKVGDKVKSVIDGFECTIESINNTCYYGDTTNFDIQDQGGWELVEQKPWSEEDERNFDIIYGIIYNSCNAEDASRLIAWLKSLRPQKQWKPSDEQIYSLDRALCFYGKDNAVYDSVKELLEQLKKLREE